jgi:hypothetical protein
MICTSCDCGCLILPYRCLYSKSSKLKSLGIENKPELLNNVNAFILIGDLTTGGILGEKCFLELCADIKKAEGLADNYRQANPSATGEQTEFWYYLSANWSKLLKNGYFQSMYANYVAYYYYNSKAASSETTLDGDVKHNRGSAGNDGEASANIDLAESKAKESVFLAYAQKYASMFKALFLEANLSDYPCIDVCGCNLKVCGIPDKDGTIKLHKPKKPRSTAL